MCLLRGSFSSDYWIYMLVFVRIGCYTFSYETCSVIAHNTRIWKYGNVNSVIRGQFQKTRTTLKQNSGAI